MADLTHSTLAKRSMKSSKANRSSRNSRAVAVASSLAGGIFSSLGPGLSPTLHTHRGHMLKTGRYSQTRPTPSKAAQHPGGWPPQTRSSRLLPSQCRQQYSPRGLNRHGDAELPSPAPPHPREQRAAATSLDRCPNPIWAQVHTHLSHLRQQPRKASTRQAAAGHGGQLSGTGPTSLPGTRGGGRSRKGLSASGTSLFSTRPGSTGHRELRNGPSFHPTKSFRMTTEAAKNQFSAASSEAGAYSPSVRNPWLNCSPSAPAMLPGRPARPAASLSPRLSNPHPRLHQGEEQRPHLGKSGQEPASSRKEGSAPISRTPNHWQRTLIHSCAGRPD